MKVPDIDLEALEEFKKKNFKDRLEFIDKYVESLKKKSNKKWSSEQKDLMDE
ncbi:MAG: hypothetical protein Q8R00_01825 [Candidatus Nanoarchaeia archaeon]|nr:hypothetical protein [Candidatus Nanoarchaeia archaeon]